MHNQIDESSTLIKRFEQEGFEQRQQHIKEEFDFLRKELLSAQVRQMNGLKEKVENETKELKQAQTKKSMDDIKSLHLVY